jgi:hypothetical protein
MKTRIFSVLLALSLGGCASVDIPPGAWTLRAPDGTTSAVEVSNLRAGEYYLRAPARTFSGSYIYKDHELSILKPDNPRMNGYVWKLERKGQLVLVEEPPVPVSGVRLTSGSLRKDN